ncbi:Sec-independent protein translocase protein TatA OS=Tsukamurella paurometabola (strain ATCC 8368 /DSM / CCUG 35730 / CIP 100753 / JCM 10117 / KCTC 9821/ NBRC 16120 / NCIMB 702349 / NCTC 13040) OX=521096 GN=tatA PE=3 SV=1 [Tsukamurella paurometabola]|uniref:Sec-independent protein translocase protein TatA n=1 Tax=Tsukamurella paurometabola (strain ATCC 8368 / DSM 20162 / CCUG 35730 / CIP 100753 / JCM 10117 / KCTC 9821 / NBRC 16120 / NCIMB 702349 / NCTC 13040) TaxID=521096 RepID=D5UPM3_TSUPD|nr:Sec-independent protein translocase subunit TatA [Tsukamurella paurometabola]ADG78779.1 twin-arginine translocation protein, TatA/E family subunit [Tsukamurella paurometabola DSM 20162]SUP33122.1 Sec-independent protein translocase protein TatA [Tsukamurella paurometabola]
MGITHSPWAWIVIAVVLLLLFGGKKLPDAARGLGRSMRIFKSEMDEMKTEGTKTEADKPAPQVTDKPIDVQTVDPQEADRKSA